MIWQSTYQSPVGRLFLASDGVHLTGLWMEGQKYFGSTANEQMVLREDLPLFYLTKAWLDRYFAGRRPEISDIPLAPAGSEFRQAVWKLLCQIPYGEVITYGVLARKLDQTGMSAQAVGGAVGHNPISIIIPCHRVVGADGSLTGYAGGLEAKRFLLEMEALYSQEEKSGYYGIL